MQLDIEKYLPFLGNYNWSRAEKIEMLRTVWRMMEAQADKAFGLSPQQLSCEQEARHALREAQDSVNSKLSLSQRHKQAANDNAYHQKGQRHAG